jgi:cell wall-associated NlpC family hydrolase
MMAYQAAGISIPGTTYPQVDAGTLVYGFSQLQPGDLLFSAGSDGSDSNTGSRYPPNPPPRLTGHAL